MKKAEVDRETGEKIVRIQWSRPQSRAILSQARYLDLEGAIRAGKTTVLIWKFINALQEHPGMYGLLTRWTQDSLDAQLKPQFWELCPRELLKAGKAWNGTEEYVEFQNGSRLYMRALKSADEGARYVKTAGLEFSIIGLDQPEEVPRDVYEYLKGRLSQKGYPQQFIVTPNPPDPNHWLCEEFPEDNTRPNYEYIHFTIWDNKHNLHPDYIAALEQDYPANHPMRKRLLFGLRGAQSAGTPVYGKVFKRDIHVKPVEPLVSAPIIESWDFGFSNPAVSWSQITPWGAWHILGELQGRNAYLEDFIPKVLAKRKALVKHGQPVWVTCDPSGVSPTSHGTRRTAVGLLNEQGIYPTVTPNANRAEQKIYAIQHLARLMLRLTPDGPALQVHPDCVTITDGFATGYAYPEKLVRGLQIPAKDGFYDHLQNTLEYAVLAFLIPEHPDVVPVVEVDEDEDMDYKTRRGTVSSRSGY